MTSRERVYAGIRAPAAGHGADRFLRAPVVGHRGPGLRRACGRTWACRRGPVRVYDPIQQLAIVDEDVLQRFGVDTVEMGRGFSHDIRGLAGMDAAGRQPLPHARVGEARAQDR